MHEYNAEFHTCKFRRIVTMMFYSRCFICDVGWIHSYLSSVLPIGATFALTLWLGNTSYLYISVSFAQMLKSISKFVSLYHVLCLRYGGLSWSLFENAQLYLRCVWLGLDLKSERTPKTCVQNRLD